MCTPQNGKLAADWMKLLFMKQCNCPIYQVSPIVSLRVVYGNCPKILYTANPYDKMLEQTVQTQIRMKDQSEQGLHYITKTRLYNFDPLKPHFYIVKLGFTGVYIIFLISAQNIDCWYSLELPRRGGSNEYLQSMFWAEIWKISDFFIWNFSVFWRWNFLYIWIGMFS